MKSAKSVKTQSASSSAFQLTINEIDRFGELKEYLSSLKPLQYAVAAEEEAPTTGHKHAHIYAQFSRSIRLSLKKLAGAHLEKCLGSPQQNDKYVRKNGHIIWEYGAMKTKGGKTIAELKAMEPAERETMPAMYYNIVQKINAEEAKAIKVDDYFKEREVYYIYGESGAGKTREAIKMLKERGIETFNEIKCINGFWHGVTESDGAALYDDFRYSHMSASEFINFIDYNRHTFNVKGGSVRNNYKLIIITSIQAPEDLYPTLTEKDEEPKKQWLRRMKKIEIILNK
jgi:hypothetical protein